jgi:hypothetical protein
MSLVDCSSEMMTLNLKIPFGMDQIWVSFNLGCYWFFLFLSFQVFIFQFILGNYDCICIDFYEFVVIFDQSV